MVQRVAILIALLIVGCSPTLPETSENPYPVASCPGAPDATWCLLFSDHSTGAITLTERGPKAAGYLQLDTLRLPFKGVVADNSFSLTTVSSDEWVLHYPATITGTFAASGTFATVKMAFFSVDETFSAYTPSSFPTLVTIDPARSVTGEWELYSAQATHVTTLQLVQRGRLLLLSYTLMLQGTLLVGNYIELLPGTLEADGAFSFPSSYPIADGGSWLHGRFADGLTMATVTKCDDSIVGPFCTDMIWRRGARSAAPVLIGTAR